MGARATRVGDGLHLARPWRSLGWRGRLRAPGACGAMRRGPCPLRSLLRRPHRPPPLGASPGARIGWGRGRRGRLAGRREPICFGDTDEGFLSRERKEKGGSRGVMQTKGRGWRGREGGGSARRARTAGRPSLSPRGRSPAGARGSHQPPGEARNRGRGAPGGRRECPPHRTPGLPHPTPARHPPTRSAGGTSPAHLPAPRFLPLATPAQGGQAGAEGGRRAWVSLPCLNLGTPARRWDFRVSRPPGPDLARAPPYPGPAPSAPSLPAAAPSCSLQFFLLRIMNQVWGSTQKVTAPV